MKQKTKIFLPILLIILVLIISFLLIPSSKGEIISVASEDELLQIYHGNTNLGVKEKFITVLTMPFGLLVADSIGYGGAIYETSDVIMNSSLQLESIAPGLVTTGKSDSAVISNDRDYSTTNIQVENVDEADIIKTDGNYIYSLSGRKVVITDVTNKDFPVIVSTIEMESTIIPNDLIINDDKLVVISTRYTNTGRYSYYYYNNIDTIVRVYNISDKDNPLLKKEYEIYEPYYTSRCINGKLYVISSGRLRMEDDEVIRTYKENGTEKEIDLKEIKRLKGINTRIQTVISVTNLNDIEKDTTVLSYLMDISNAYVSEKSIYLLDTEYDSRYGVPPISSLFGLKGAFGPFFYEDENEDWGEKTKIYKFDILEDGTISYKNKAKVKGETINQYSLDEKDGHLRVALYCNEGSRIVIFDEELNEIGASDYVAEGESMYSSRFIGDKAYFVTYLTKDPLFVVDLSNEEKPEVLGELHIPGYSTYLHPYDENHLIGIGMETEEIINRDSEGKVTFVTDRVLGMKMALFDVSDINNPVQMSQVVIGDSRTSSAILTNPKALLFSKEKGLIAIPVNNYKEDFKIETSTDSIDTLINKYSSYSKDYVAEGYFVYNINLEDGFNLKGVITHETSNAKTTNYYYNVSRLLRGLYIDENLYTVSENALKVNRLDTLELVNEMKIK